MVRQGQAKQRQAVQKYRRDVRQAEQKINREIQAHNRKARRAIDQYNSDVRAYNRQVNANKTRIQSALKKLGRATVTTRYNVLHTSTQTLNDAYIGLREQPSAPVSSDKLDVLRSYAELENANSLDVTNALLGEASEEEATEEDLAVTAITSELSRIADDLDSRWNGAVYALSPRNPDAARHFCTSAREIITTILDVKAPDTEVLAANPDCAKAHDGTPTRRALIHHCLERKGLADDGLEIFVNEDINNVIELFKALSAGTHGPAGAYGLAELYPLKRRVEDAILFLAKIVD